MRDLGKSTGIWKPRLTWWPSTIEAANKVIEELDGIDVSEIGRSAGGRPIITASWGGREELKTTSTSLHSSLASGVGDPDQMRLFPKYPRSS